MQMTYETHYKSNRKDGRHVSTMAAFMERLRNTKPLLEFPEHTDQSGFSKWKEELKNKIRELLLIFPFTEQPLPKKINEVQRDGYRVEKWEFYPDDYSAVPFLVLIPDDVTEQNKAPGVLCLPGSIHSKEFISGEPLLDTPKCRFEKYPERNRMAQYMVKNGMVAFAFDNPETAECALEIEREGDWGGTSRTQMCCGLLYNGESYFSLSLFQKLCFLRNIGIFNCVDQDRLAVSAHSLGCDDAMYLGLLCDEIKAVVFNDFVCDERHRYFATTEYDERKMCNHNGDWHIIPGMYKYYSRVDVLAALAPKYLTLNEGGADYFLDKIKKAYSLNAAADNLHVHYYPKYREEGNRSKIYEPPMYGLSEDTYFEYANCDAPDHSFREEAANALLKKAFFE